MEKELYVVYFESANYAGYGEHCLVWATSEDEARESSEVNEYAEDFYREQDEDAYYEDNDIDPDDLVEGITWSRVMTVEKLTGSEHEEYVAKQPAYYPIVNFK